MVKYLLFDFVTEEYFYRYLKYLVKSFISMEIQYSLLDSALLFEQLLLSQHFA